MHTPALESCLKALRKQFIPPHGQVCFEIWRARNGRNGCPLQLVFCSENVSRSRSSNSCDREGVQYINHPTLACQFRVAVLYSFAF